MRPMHPETTKEYKVVTDEEKRALILVYEDDKDDFQDERKEFNKRVAQYKTNSTNAFDLILGQCTLEFKDKLKARTDWTTIGNDPTKLLSAIREMVFEEQDTQNKHQNFWRAIQTIHNAKQGEQESFDNFARRFLLMAK